MYIATGSVWRKAPTGDSVVWSGDKVVEAVTGQNVIIRNEFISTMTPTLNREEVVSRTDFERDYVTKAEASRRINAAYKAAMDKVKPKAVLGTPVMISASGAGGGTYEASNGTRIRFTADGHYYVENVNGNPVSTFDAAWIARKSAELQKSYQARQRYSFTTRNYWA